MQALPDTNGFITAESSNATGQLLQVRGLGVGGGGQLPCIVSW